jgi:hypothetical protein
VSTGASILLIAAGATLTWAVNAQVEGVELRTVGVILLVVGAVGLLLSLLLAPWWNRELPPPD